MVEGDDPGFQAPLDEGTLLRLVLTGVFANLVIIIKLRLVIVINVWSLVGLL